MRHATALPTNYSSDLKHATFLQWWHSYHQANGLRTPTVDEGAHHGLRDPQVYPRMWLLACTEQHWADFSDWATEAAAHRVRASSAVAIFVNANGIVLKGKPFLLILEPREMSRVEADRFSRGWWETAIPSLTTDLTEAAVKSPQLVA